MPFKTISPAEVARLLAAGPLSILDVRTPAEFARVHAVGAQSMPLDDLDATALAAAHGNNPVYVICHSGARSAKACQRIVAAGAGQVSSIEGGTTAWEQMGLPVERGCSNVISLERQVRIGAGALVLLGAILAWAFHPGFLAVSAFVGAGLVFAGITGTCGMAMVLTRMPWNR